jgi:flagellar assembly factor FliW
VASGDDESNAVAVLPRFGSCCYRESDVLVFPWGVPGFGTLRRFLPIVLDDDEGGRVWLQSLDDVTVALPAVDPATVDAAYAPRLPHYAVASLELRADDDVALLCVCDARSAIDLAAPIVVNLRTRVGRQIVLEHTVRRSTDGVLAGAGA